MRRCLPIGLLAFVASLAVVATASAQSGHFVGTVTCTDQGTTLQCSGKVAGLGGTTFQITASVAGVTADSVCTNKGGNIAPGQDFSFGAVGSSGPLSTPTSGNYNFSISTATPAVPAGSCPNGKWTGTVTDVDFAGKTAVLTLTEDGDTSDTISVLVQ